MTSFNWHGDTITAETPVTSTYRNTKNVRRFLEEICGPDFKFNREFMAWIKDGEPKTMGDVASEWLRLEKKRHIKRVEAAVDKN